MDNLFGEDMYNDHCCDCGEELTEDNTSIWTVGTTLNDKQVSARVCVMCSAVRDRHLSSCRIIRNAFVPMKTPDQCKAELEAEGYTIEILKQRERNMIEDKH